MGGGHRSQFIAAFIAQIFPDRWKFDASGITTYSYARRYRLTTHTHTHTHTHVPLILGVSAGDCFRTQKRGSLPPAMYRKGNLHRWVLLAACCALWRGLRLAPFTS